MLKRLLYLIRLNRAIKARHRNYDLNIEKIQTLGTSIRDQNFKHSFMDW